jgi:hypothetical protein
MIVDGLYRVVPVDGGMIGGHYAIETPDRDIILQTLGMDFQRANLTCNELMKAFNLGRSSTGSPMEMELDRSGEALRMASEGQKILEG